MTTSVYQSSPDLTIKEHRIELKRGARRFAFEFGSITPRCWYAHNVLTGARTGAPSLTAVMTWTEQEADRMAREPEDTDPTPTAPASVPLLCALTASNTQLNEAHRERVRRQKSDEIRRLVRRQKAHAYAVAPHHIFSGPVICLPAPKPEDDPTPPTSPAAEQALDKFIDVMKQAIDAEAALIDADPVIAWSLQSKALAAWNNACGYADRYINHYGLYYSNMFGISRQSDHALLWDVKLRPVQQAVA